MVKLTNAIKNVTPVKMGLWTCVLYSRYNHFLNFFISLINYFPFETIFQSFIIFIVEVFFLDETIAPQVLVGNVELNH